jgi:hypothetical protein
MRSLLAVAVYFFGASQPLIAALVIDSVTPSRAEDFDTLAGTGLGDIVDWENNVTLTGWYLFRVLSGGGSDPVESYQVSDGGHNSGKFHSFGTTSTERALGSVGNGNFGGFNPDVTTGIAPGDVAGWIAVSFINNMGTALDQFTMHYDGEQWRDGGNDPAFSQTMEFEYGIGSTFDTVMTWHKPGASFNFVSPQNTTTAGALDGNKDDIAMVNREAGIGGTVTGVGWDPDEILWLRWVERNDNAFDHGLAIDNFSFSVSAVPEPGAALFGGVVGGLIMLIVIGRRWADARRR